MTFLYPLFGAGVLAIGVPIWLHLRRKPRADVRQFSALRFLEDQPLPKAAPWQLRDLLLFLLRSLALLSLVGALAWPYLQDDLKSKSSESTVYVLDNTLSNQAGDAFQSARARVLEEIGGAPADAQIAVIELSSQPRVVAAFSDSRAELAAKLAALQPGYGRGSFLNAMSLANTLLERSLGTVKRIRFYSDNQENQWRENLSTPPFLNGVEVTCLQSASTLQTRANMALQEPQAARFYSGEKSLVNFTGLLRRAGEVKEARVTLRVNGQEIFNRPVAAEPSDVRLESQWESDPALWVKGELSVAGGPDGLAADNRLYFVLPPVSEGRVAVLAQSPYLRTAFGPEVMRGHWAVKTLQPTQLAAEVQGALDCDVLLLEASYLQSKEARELMLRYLNNGRGVVLLLNRTSPLVDATLLELGFQLERGASSALNPAPAGAAGFRYVAIQHPIFAPFRSPDFGELSNVRVEKHVNLRSGSAVPLAMSEAGEGLLFEGTTTKGKLIVAGFGFERAQTDWPLQLSFIPFLDAVLQHVRGRKEAETLFEPGEIYPLQIGAGETVHEIVLSAVAGAEPAGGAAAEALGPVRARFAVNANGRAEVRVPDQPGVYALSYDGEPRVRNMLAVNPSPKESDLAVAAEPVALAGWKYPAELARSEPVGAAAAVSRAAILQQRYWWWVLLAGIGLLVGESLALCLRKVEP